MNAATVTEKKPATVAAKDQKAVAATVETQAIAADNQNAPAGQEASANQTAETAPVKDLKSSIEKLDAEMKEKLTAVIEGLVPGNPASFNTGIVKEVAKLENKKNRMIAGRLELLLRKGNPEAKEMADRLLAIAV